MDLWQIEHIIKIAEERNITRAAEKLFLTQSALNQQLLKLEHELGTPLFKRSKTNLSPTKAGEIYLEGAREIIRVKQRTYSRIADLTDSNKGHIIVGFTPGRGPDMFTNVYPIFHKNYPNMVVEPREMSVAKIQPLIASGDLDLAFVTLFPSQRTEDEYLLLYDEEIFLAVPGNHAVNKYAVEENGHITIPFSALKDESFILMHKESTLRKVLNQLFRNAQFVPNLLFDTANNSTIMEMVKAGICCGIVPQYATKHYRNCGIKYYSFPTPLRWDVMVTYSKGAMLSNAAKLFIQYAKEYWVNA
jgi:DNA-binding transcriptional LysR family regulator